MFPLASALLWIFIVNGGTLATDDAATDDAATMMPQHAKLDEQPGRPRSRLHSYLKIRDALGTRMKTAIRMIDPMERIANLECAANALNLNCPPLNRGGFSYPSTVFYMAYAGV
jgi:hypothetical protein